MVSTGVLLALLFVERYCWLSLCLGVRYILLFSSCLEWRYTHPLLEEAGLEAWAVDILGWGFSDLGSFICFSFFLVALFAQVDF